MAFICALHRPSISSYFSKPAAPKRTIDSVAPSSKAKAQDIIDVGPSKTRSKPTSIAGSDDELVDLTDSPPPAKRQRLRSVSPTKALGLATDGARSTLENVDQPMVHGKSKDASPTTMRHSAKRGIEKLLNTSLPATNPGPGKVSLAKFIAPPVVASTVFDSGLAFGNYTVSPSAPKVSSEQRSQQSLSLDESRSGQGEAARLKRHAKWQKRLMSGNLIPRRRSLGLDEAEAASIALAAARGEIVEGSGGVTEDAEDEDTQILDDSGITGRNSKSKQVDRTKSGTSKPKGKKAEEIGPSGMAYTPLEKQVCLKTRFSSVSVVAWKFSRMRCCYSSWRSKL